MNELIEILEAIGIPTTECARIRRQYDGNLEGLRAYVLCGKTLFDDRHEYVE